MIIRIDYLFQVSKNLHFKGRKAHLKKDLRRADGSHYKYESDMSSFLWSLAGVGGNSSAKQLL